MPRVTIAALAVLLCTACDGGSAKAKPEGVKAAAKPEAKAPEAKAAEAKAAEPASSEPAVTEAPAAADPLGQRFRDPVWFRDTLFGDKGTKVDFARSEANEAGLFKSHLIFELEEGTTVDDCATMISDKLKDATELTREDQPNDRAQLTGSTERYNVTVVCGEGKGKMRAYVAYEWTR